MSEQDQHDNTPETNDEPQDTAGQGGMNSTGDANTGDANTGDGADHVEHRGEQAAQDEASVEQVSAEQSAEQASTDQEKGTEQQPEEAEAPEDLFDLMGEEGKKHKKKKPEPQQGAKQGQGSAQQQKEEKKFPAQAEIVYAGHRITIPREMSATEIIDELLADDFPELTKDSTEFNHDEQRNRIVPTRKALKKGSSSLQRQGGGSLRPCPTTGANDQPRSLTVHTRLLDRPLPPVHRVLAHDGVYEVRDTDLGTFTARIPGEATMYERASLKVPKAPVSLLRKTIAIFKGKPDTEAILTIVYDHRRKSHRLVWVDQTTSRSRVHYDSITEDEGLTVYAEIHSHNSMEAFFSPIDDGSEARSTGLYGVIGRVDLDRPHALFRYSCGHHFRRIPAMSLFDDPKRVNELLVEAVQ